MFTRTLATHELRMQRFWSGGIQFDSRHFECARILAAVENIEAAMGSCVEYDFSNQLTCHFSRSTGLNHPTDLTAADQECAVHSESSARMGELKMLRESLRPAWRQMINLRSKPQAEAAVALSGWTIHLERAPEAPIVLRSLVKNEARGLEAHAAR